MQVMAPSPEENPAERGLTALPGWLFLLAGLALIAAAVLTPTWLQARELAHRHRVLEARAEALGAQRARYEQFHEALKQHDPVLLERLAYVQLRMKPADAKLLAPQQPSAIPGGGEGSDQARLGAAMLPISAWLHVPLPKVGREIPPLQPVDTRLVRLATGHTRHGMLAAGALCAIGGLFSGTGRRGVAASPS
jgi:hypothetical protein